MPKTIGWGILGPGGIAKSFAADLAKVSDAALIAVGSRSRHRAEAFAEQFGVRRAYDGRLSGNFNHYRELKP